MHYLKTYIGQQVELELSEDMYMHGLLVRVGLDILILYNDTEYIYIPHTNIHCIKLRTSLDTLLYEDCGELPLFQEDPSISYRKTLLYAKGQFVKIYVAGKIIHGYITNVCNDYFVFYSPVYKTMCISLQHVKWLIPYHSGVTPYTLRSEALPVTPTSIAMQRSLDEQLKKMQNTLLVLDYGEHPLKIGLLKKVYDGAIQLIAADGQEMYWRISHIQTIHSP